MQVELIKNKLPHDVVDVITEMDFILTPHRTRHMTGSIRSLELKNGHLLTASHHELVLWNTETSLQIRSCPLTYPIETLCELPDEQFIMCYYRPDCPSSFSRFVEVRDTNLTLLRSFALHNAFSSSMGCYHGQPLVRTHMDMFASLDIKTGLYTELFPSPSRMVVFKVYNNDTIFTLTTKGECIVYRNYKVVYQKRYPGYHNTWNDDTHFIQFNQDEFKLWNHDAWNVDTHWIQFNKDEFKVWNRDTLQFDNFAPVPRIPLASEEERLRNVHRVAGGFIIVIMSTVCKNYCLIYYMDAKTQKARLWKFIKTEDYQFHDTSLLSNGMLITKDAPQYPNVSPNHNMHSLYHCVR